MPAVKLKLDASDGALGLALLCVALGAMAAMPAAGWLGARGVKRLLSGTTLLLAVMLPLPALAGDVPMLCAALFGFGAGAGSLDVCMNARASRLEQGWGAAIMSSFHAAFSLGGLLGTLITAACEAAGAGVLAGLALCSLLLLAALVLHLVLDPASELAAPELATPARPGARRARSGIAPPLGVLVIGALAGLAFMTEGAVADWSGVFLGTVAGLGTAAAAAGFAAFSVGMVAMRLGGDALVRRHGAQRVLRAGAVLAGAGMALAVAMPMAGPAGFLLVGLGAANIAPILFSAAGRLGPTAIAAVATIGYGGMLLGPPLIGGLADWAGLRLAMLTLAAAMAVTASAAGRIRA